MADRRLDTPTAILLAGALVGVAVFFGLRSRPANAPAPPRGAVEASPPAPRAPPPHAAAPEPRDTEAPGVAPAASGSQAAGAAKAPLPGDITREALRAIDEHRAALVKKCWAPAIKNKPSPTEARFYVDVTFDAKGKQTLRGIKGDPETSRPGVTECVTGTLPPLQIPAPGVPSHADVSFRLP